MTSRERILGTLGHHLPDKIPWIPQATRTFFLSLSGYREKFHSDKNWHAIDRHLIPEELEYRVNTYHKVGADFMDWLPSAYRAKREKVKEKEIRREDKVYMEYQTIIGNLTQEFNVSNLASAAWCSKFLVKSEEDFKILEYILKDVIYELNDEDVQRRMDIIGEGGVVFWHAPSAPIQQLLLGGELGVEGTLFALYDSKPQMEHLMKVMDEKNEKLCKIISDSSGKILQSGNVIGIGMISPQIFQKYALPYIKKYTQILHQDDKIVIGHSSGEPIKNLLTYISETGIDALHGISLSGDVKVSEMRQAWDDRVVIIGGLDVHFLATAKPEKIKSRVKSIIDEVMPEGNFIFGTADDIAYGTPLKNIEAVSEVIEKWGHYSSP